MKTPPFLRKGDKIGIVAPARKITREELQDAVTLFESNGFEVVFGKYLFGADHQFSGSDAERAADLQAMLDDPSVKAIISARGGYGTLRIIDMLDFTAFRRQPKWIIGYSDITVLHSHVHNLGIETLHATMPVNFSRNAEATATLMDALSGDLLQYTAGAHPLNRPGIAEAELVGGNLSLLYALTGSVSDINTKGKILFIEDLDEYLYHIDRMLLGLKRSGKLGGLAGLVIGGMTDMKDNAVPFGKTAAEIILDAVKEYDFPLCFDFPAGHVDRNLALVLGRKVKLEVNAGQSLLTF